MKIKHELKRLAVIEGLSGFGFIALYFGWLKEFNLQFSTIVFYPILCCSIVLLQGSVFWGFCLKHINIKTNRICQLAHIYRILRRFDLLLLLIYPLLLFIFGNVMLELLIGVGFYVFAILEYINYFYVRLSYPILEFLLRAVKLDFDESRIAKDIGRV